MAHLTALQPGSGPVRGAYVPTTPDTVLWGPAPLRDDAPLLTVDVGAEVTFDAVSHEGILEDQGRDPLAFFGAHGVPEHAVLRDAVELAASSAPHTVSVDGPHGVSRPVAVAVAVDGARVGDLLAITVVELEQRVPYGVISNRHGRGALLVGRADDLERRAAVHDRLGGGHRVAQAELRLL